MGVLVVPKWLQNMLEHAGGFTESGLTGLLDYHAETNTLGELLARGEATPAQLQEFLDSVRKPVAAVAYAATAAMSGVGSSPMEVILRTGPENFWTVAWNEILGEQMMRERKIIIPPFPTLKAKTQTAIKGGLGTWIPIYLPAAELTEADYPAEFVKPAWGKHLTESDIQRRPLQGRWVIVETIPKPEWNDQNGYGNGNDPLVQALGLTTRFFQSWNDLHETHLPKVAKHLGLSKRAVRLCTAEEWNLVGNLFLWLNANRNMAFPDLGSTNSWEWCENTYGDDVRLIVGSRGRGGLAGVGCSWRVFRHGHIGFRVLAVL